VRGALGALVRARPALARALPRRVVPTARLAPPSARRYRAQGLSGDRAFSAASPFHTTLSAALLTHLELAVSDVLQRGVAGDFLEAGVFRGGATIFLRGLLAAHERGGPSAAARAAARARVRCCCVYIAWRTFLRPPPHG
jgi:hypothetical protein